MAIHPVARTRRRGANRWFALAAVLYCCLLGGCLSRKPLYVYLAYQDPQTSDGAYYLRKALVVAPDHATALAILAETISDVHPSLSGPLYVSLVGVCEDRRRPGLLGGPIWLETTAGHWSPPSESEPRVGGAGTNPPVGPHSGAGTSSPPHGSR